MKEWYYQIKGKLGTPEQGMWGSSQNWSWPPIFVGKVEAIDRKSAVDMVHRHYGVKFPTRVLAKDLSDNEYLMAISEITDERTKSLFLERICVQCDATFKTINHYNDHNQRYKGSEYCSDECKQSAYEVSRYVYSTNNEMNGIHPPVIYRVHNIVTGQCYIGKTTQAFTLRWYQHFYQTGNTKFHQAIKSSDLPNWSFMVLEKVVMPENVKSKKDCETYIFEREKNWIRYYDAVANGYNSLC